MSLNASGGFDPDFKEISSAAVDGGGNGYISHPKVVSVTGVGEGEEKQEESKTAETAATCKGNELTEQPNLPLVSKESSRFRSAAEVREIT